SPFSVTFVFVVVVPVPVLVPEPVLVPVLELELELDVEPRLRIAEGSSRRLTWVFWPTELRKNVWTPLVRSIRPPSIRSKFLRLTTLIAVPPMPERVPGWALALLRLRSGARPPPPWTMPTMPDCWLVPWNRRFSAPSGSMVEPARLPAPYRVTVT